MTIHLDELPMNHSFFVYPVINEVVVLIKIVDKSEMLYFDKNVTENQHILSKYKHRKAYVGQY